MFLMVMETIYNFSEVLLSMQMRFNIIGGGYTKLKD